jgi:hypothetical protein
MDPVEELASCTSITRTGIARDGVGEELFLTLEAARLAEAAARRRAEDTLREAVKLIAEARAATAKP